ncbi:hypothetical protein OKW96_04895 [Sphingobacterium sp. KU25419]|nr:hypothetical protein OKW96_04895 [Sphingobacterium sp. KU25419]
MMRKNLIFTLFVLAAICIGHQAKAQVSASTNPVTVNIDLQASVISIALDAAPTVNFVYATAAEYAAAKTVTKPAHLTVISNKPYDIAVKANGLFTSSNSSNTTNLPALGVVGISIDGATANGGTLSPVSLTQGDQDLVTNASATTTSVFNVDYTIASATTLIALPKEVYTTTVTYTATQL